MHNIFCHFMQDQVTCKQIVSAKTEVPISTNRCSSLISAYGNSNTLTKQRILIMDYFLGVLFVRFSWSFYRYSSLEKNSISGRSLKKWSHILFVCCITHALCISYRYKKNFAPSLAHKSKMDSVSLILVHHFLLGSSLAGM